MGDVKKNESNPLESATSEKFEHGVLNSNFAIFIVQKKMCHCLILLWRTFISHENSTHNVQREKKLIPPSCKTETK